MAKSVTKDMTSGSPMKLILQFCIPLFFGMLFQQFYSMMDTIIVGKFLGVGALAAVGATGSINFMIIGFCMGVCNGFAIPVAQQFGAGDYHALRKYVANSVWLSIAFSGVMTVAVCVFCRRILLLMNTPADIMDGAFRYIFVIFLGIPVVYLYNLLSGIIRSLGDSKSPLIFLIFSSVLNIVLDMVLILVFHMGVSGAAWATVISQAISGAACLIYMIKRFDILKMSGEEWQADGIYMKNLCNMGIPMGLQYSITAIGSVILQTAVNTLGSMAVAAIAAAAKIGMFFCCPFDAMGSTMATYAGQNVGAGKLERVSAGMKSTCMLGLVYSVLAFVVLALSGKTIALLFVSPSEHAILQDVNRYLVISAAFFFPLALVNIVRFTIQGLGFSRFAILAGVCEMAARSLVGMGFVPVFGYIAACFASPVAWICADLFLIPAYLYVMKKLYRMMGHEPVT
ncbi:MATE efflux family protein [Eubacterium sp. 14-2]|uniref:MATE family efflux transporter n=1 Tax=Eubacterium sp. 14-2 TaxID=1235790 RepID=UPI0003364D66|nr:MATE family efflux transporter [Eubacterium sp. 14-2]EOT26567.1 MATE efflux family protein [Eubacterium sp. 14-2]